MEKFKLGFKYHAHLMFILISCYGQLMAQQSPNWAVELIPDSLLEGAHSVVRYERITHEIKSTEIREIQHQKVITVLNEESTEDLLVLSYDRESKIQKIEATLYDQFGQEIRSISSDEIKDISAVSGFSIFEDDRIKYLEVNHSEFPYTIAYTYKKRLKGFQNAYAPRWYVQSFHQSLEEGIFEVNFPIEEELYYEQFNLDTKPTTNFGDKTKQYVWKLHHLSAITKEAHGFSEYQALPSVYTALETFEIDGRKGKLDTWEHFGAFIFKLFEEQKALPEALILQVSNLTAHATSDQEKIAILYKYLQEEYRYVSVQLGIGGWQPFSNEYVWEQKYGDCKALSNLMRCMLKEVGINAYPALIYNGDQKLPIPKALAYPVFNHVVLYVPEHHYWLECTSNIMPPNYLGASNSNRNALLLTESGGQLVDAPSLGMDENVAIGRSVFYISEDGSAQLDYEASLTGQYNETYRAADYFLDKEELKERLIENTPISRVDFTAIDILPNAERSQTTMTYQAAMPKFAKSLGKRLFIPVNPIHSNQFVLSKDTHRKTPVVIDLGYQKVDSLFFEIPANFQIESGIDSLTLETSFGTFEAKSIPLDDDRFGFIRMLKVKKQVVAPSNYEDLRQFFLQITKWDQSRMVLIKRKT